MEGNVKRYSIRHLYYKLYYTINQVIHPEWPWWCNEAVFICGKLIRKSDSVLEFGSGRSTFWLASRSQKIISVENDRGWYEKVKAKLEQAGIQSKVNLIFAGVEDNISPEIQPYLLSVKNIPANSLDFVIIDGKFRGHAAKLSIPLLKTGGVLMIDDVQRYLPDYTNGEINLPQNQYAEVWKEVYEQIKGWRTVWTTDGLRCSLFAIKS